MKNWPNQNWAVKVNYKNGDVLNSNSVHEKVKDTALNRYKDTLAAKQKANRAGIVVNVMSPQFCGQQNKCYCGAEALAFFPLSIDQ